MGQKKQRKEAFKRAHPLCCFCGGLNPTSTYDHQPPRSVFERRQSPDDFLFPACDACNNETRTDEQVTALVALLGSNYSDDGQQRFKRLLTGVRNNIPDALPTVDISANEKRAMLRHVGIQKDPNILLDDVPIAGLPVAAVKAMERHFRKLALALYYRELKAIAPLNSLVGATVVPNATFMSEEAIASIIGPFRFLRMSKLQNRDVSAQFAYKCDLGMDRRLFGAIAKLHTSVIGILCVCTDPDLIKSSDGTEWYNLRGEVVVAPVSDLG